MATSGAFMFVLSPGWAAPADVVSLANPVFLRPRH
jgi:hypothetical protein